MDVLEVIGSDPRSVLQSKDCIIMKGSSFFLVIVLLRLYLKVLNSYESCHTELSL